MSSDHDDMVRGTRRPLTGDVASWSVSPLSVKAVVKEHLESEILKLPRFLNWQVRGLLPPDQARPWHERLAVTS